MSISSSQSTRGASSTDGQRGIVRWLLLTVAWLLLTLVPAAFGHGADRVISTAQLSAIEQHRIDYLIASVAALKNASFIRNGKAYDAARAASHLRLKRRFAGSKIKTAEDFIRYCGTASSMSGSRYTIRFADGHSMDSASFFQQKLALYRSEKSAGPQSLGTPPIKPPRASASSSGHPHDIDQSTAVLLRSRSVATGQHV